MTLSENEKAVLIALRRGKHFKANPVSPGKLVDLPSDEAHPVGRHLVKLGLAARVLDSDRPAALLLRITDAGIAEADKLLHENRKLSFRERAVALPIGKGVWDLFKVGFGAVIGYLTKSLAG